MRLKGLTMKSKGVFCKMTFLDYIVFKNSSTYNLLCVELLRFLCFIPKKMSENCIFLGIDKGAYMIYNVNVPLTTDGFADYRRGV